MSPIWIVRLALIAALFVYLGFSRIVLSDRKRYHCILKNGPLNIVFVIIYNGLCYLAVGLHPDPRVIAKPVIFGGPLVANWYAVLGQVLILTSACLLVYTVVKRNAIGGQDTGGILLTSGVYAFSRHPIYLGIVLIALGISIVRVNIDGMLVFPLVFIANYLQAGLEEKLDVGKRFRKEYEYYRKHTLMFGPLWFWVLVSLSLLAPLVATEIFVAPLARN
jgi:protein-S-isoprenylcysteine O-methyltransferase Ste14